MADGTEVPGVVEEPDLTAWRFERLEQALRDNADAELRDLEPSREAVALLAHTVWRHGGDPVAMSAPGAELRRVALVNLGSLAVRAAASAILLISSGYEADSHAPMRRMMEIYVRAKVIHLDRSSDQARRWLRGRDHGTPARLIEKYLGKQDKALYDLLSRFTHDDSRGLQLLWSPPAWVSVPEQQRLIDMRPGRKGHHALPLLGSIARDVTEIAVMIVEAYGTALVVPSVVSDLLRRQAGLADVPDT
jgi:hypothetical protein